MLCGCMEAAQLYRVSIACRHAWVVSTVLGLRIGASCHVFGWRCWMDGCPVNLPCTHSGPRLTAPLRQTGTHGRPTAVALPRPRLVSKALLPARSATGVATVACASCPRVGVSGCAAGREYMRVGAARHRTAPRSGACVGEATVSGQRDFTLIGFQY